MFYHITSARLLKLSLQGILSITKPSSVCGQGEAEIQKLPYFSSSGTCTRLKCIHQTIINLSLSLLDLTALQFFVIYF